MIHCPQYGTCKFNNFIDCICKQFPPGNQGNQVQDNVPRGTSKKKRPRKKIYTSRGSFYRKITRS